MQSKQDLEEWYRQRDPWGYETNEHDRFRLETILEALGTDRFRKALDVGAGEGFITQHLPAKTIHALEISDNAAKRLPKNVIRVTEPEHPYDLMIATGVLYDQYDWKGMVDILKKCKGTILTCNIADWERGQDLLGKPDTILYFPYRQYTECLCVYRKK